MDAEPDPGWAVTAAVMERLCELLAERGTTLDLAGPEPVLRGIADAYVTLAHTLPGSGRDAARRVLAELARELSVPAGRA